MLSLEDKIAVRGVESLSDAEVVALLIGDSSEGSIAQAERLVSTYHSSLAAIAAEDLARLRMVEGLGIKRALRLKVAAEWGRRVAMQSEHQLQSISSSSDVVDIFSRYFSTMQYEECWVLYLSASNSIVERHRASQGGITATVVDTRLVIKRALELLATQIILVHNHPSGVAEPSAEDIALTEKIKSAATLFDITLIDHIIIASSSSFSLRGNGLI